MNKPVEQSASSVSPKNADQSQKPATDVIGTPSETTIGLPDSKPAIPGAPEKAAVSEPLTK